jgi:hypothetical protein
MWEWYIQGWIKFSYARMPSHITQYSCPVDMPKLHTDHHQHMIQIATDNENNCWLFLWTELFTRLLCNCEVWKC